MNIPDVEEKHQISMAGVIEDPKDNVNCVSDGKAKYTEAFSFDAGPILKVAFQGELE